MNHETAFTMDTSSIKFGPGTTREVGYDLKRLGATRVMVVTDAQVARLEPVQTALDALKAAGLDAALFDRVRVEPTDASFEEAIAFARDGSFDAYLSVGGGSSIDTAKVANLYATYPADLLDYVNPPIGRGKPVPGPLKPHVAVPTTAGTGSETTGVAIFDLVEMHAKTGIAHRALRPYFGHHRPRQHAHVTPRGGGLLGAGRAVSRGRVADGAALRLEARPRKSRPAPQLSRGQPHQRHLVRQGD